MSLQFTTIALSLKVRVPYDSLQSHLVASPEIVTEELVDQILSYEQNNHLGYFAALEFYQEQDAIESDLIDAINSISWVVTDLVKNEVRTKLRPVFSSIKFDAIQTLINTLPAVRPNDAQVRQKLIEHFNLATVKLNLKTTLIQKIADPESAEKMASSLAVQWLSNTFEMVEVTASKYVSN